MISIDEQEALLLTLGRALRRRLQAYAIGGTAMMLLGLKAETKDIDIVFLNEADRAEAYRAAQALGYEPMNPRTVYKNKENRPFLLRRGDDRIDLFTRAIITATFSESMRRRAMPTHEFGNLLLTVTDPHDVIILKAVTDRPKDREDARAILERVRIDWTLITSEVKAQIALGHQRAMFETIQFLLDLRKLGVEIPEPVLSALWNLFAVREQKPPRSARTWKAPARKKKRR